MKINKKYVSDVLRKYFPEFSIRLRKSKISKFAFFGDGVMEYPSEHQKTIEHFGVFELLDDNEMEELGVIATIFHEIGHFATLSNKYNYEDFHDLSRCEADAQKWAIEAAQRLKELNVAKFLLLEFGNWGLNEGDGGDPVLEGIAPAYALGDVYCHAANENIEWREAKIGQIFPGDI